MGITEAELVAAIVATVEGVSVDSPTGSPSDALRHVPLGTPDTVTDERAFVLTPTSAPEGAESMIGDCSRTAGFALVVQYGLTASSAARVLRDGRLILDALRGIQKAYTGVQRLDVEGTSIQYQESLVGLFIDFTVTYSPED